MEPLNLTWTQTDELLEDLIIGQRNTLLNCGRQLVPTLVADDLWQPNDFPALENNPVFRYEEGVLAGYQAVQMAFRALKCKSNPFNV